MTAPLTDADLAAARAREERAFDELMRVTGMGKYATSPQGGPPQPRIAHIPADPERDTDLLIGASLRDVRALCGAVEEARRERDALARQRVGFIQAGTLDTNEQRTRAETAERERDEARARVERLTGRLDDVARLHAIITHHESEVADLRARLARVVEAAREYRKRQRAGGACDAEITKRMAEQEWEAADALDAVLAEEVGRG